MRAEKPIDEPKEEPTDDPKDEDVMPTGTKYRVLKAITVGSGQTHMPGDTVDLSGSDWPVRRAKQLVEQKFIEEVK